MPQGDGTGPFGNGPGTGRGRRKPNGCNFFTKTQGRKRLSFFAVVTPVVGALAKDITNPNGILRSLIKKLLSYRKPSLKANRNDKVEADFTVIDEQDYNQTPEKRK